MQISHNDGTASLGRNFRDTSPASTSSGGGGGGNEVSTETEAVQFFRGKLLKNKKNDPWMPIKSLAGHLSQAPWGIRECVGPQSEFRDWLLRHPLIFDIEDEDVSLKDNIKYNAVNPSSEPLVEKAYNSQFLMSPSPLDKDAPTLPYSTTPKVKRRPKSLEMLDFHSPMSPRSPMKSLPTPSPSPRAGPTSMTANEYKAVMFIKSILEKKGSMKLGSLTGHFSQAPESLRNTVGWSKHELDSFLCSHTNIFVIDDSDTVSVVPKARLNNVIITGSKPVSSPKPAVTNRKGRIYHIAKLWGIIDLGRHEHVFIDRNIFGKHIDDLNRLMCVGEEVCFDAIPAPKGSRARWRAIKVWKENESIEDLIEKVATRLQLPIDGIPYKEPPSPITNIDEEMRSIIPELNDASIPLAHVNVGGIKYAFGDAVPSGTGVVPVWNFKHTELSGMKDVDDLDLDDDVDSQTLSMVAERYYMNRSVLGDSPREEADPKVKVNGVAEETNKTREQNGTTKSLTKPGMADACCQTIVTGEVLATQLYQEEK